MLDKVADPYRVAMDQALQTPDRVERIWALLLSAIDEALTSLPTGGRLRLAVQLALPEESAQFTRQDIWQLTNRVMDHLAPRGKIEIQALPRGHAAGILGLANAQAMIASGVSEIVLVAGADSHIDPDLLAQLDHAGRLMSTTNRWGYPPGEAAGAFVLASPRVCSGSPLGHLLATGLAEEPNRIATPAICTGVGLASALRQALERLSPAPFEMLCDINGERYRNAELLYASLRLPPGCVADPASFQTAVDCWGDVGAATGPLLLVLAMAAGQRGYAAVPRALLWASSESGLRGAAVIERTLSRGAS